ncbi:LysR family transcriptional regulator [Massilia orientalis]|uniref:LysR family transcriptional regulator n=1 Tax=Massilia orientalis TaxID=3050128 RepID=A0ACC7MIY6_9BURK|nr:LysR family transcriptional regulator [Massilia sp. YIM B02787]
MQDDLLRQLHAFGAVAESGGIRPSSLVLARSPATSTRAVARMERILAVMLFERTVGGMRLTPAGAGVLARARRIRDELAAVHAQALDSRQRTGPVAALSALFNERRLQLAVALALLGRMPDVAHLADVSQPAVSQAIARLEADLGQPVFVRGGPRMEPTDIGSRWIIHFTRVLHELQQLRQCAGAYRP